MNYYNENNKISVKWLRNLIDAGLIPKGEIDTRSITEVSSQDVKGFTQCHFFAGIGGWCLALQMAGWSEDREIWTGSCPCQPFSLSGNQRGVRDERHLWPEFMRIIRGSRPGVVMGEQVATKFALEWLDHVFDDLEAEGYTAGAVDLCAAGVGAPHIRSRLFWVASYGEEPLDLCPLGNTLRPRLEVRQDGVLQENRRRVQGEELSQAGPLFGAWGGCDWLRCTDNDYRAAKPGSFPLVNGLSGRVGAMQAIGNSLVPQVAAEVIKAWMECHPC